MNKRKDFDKRDLLSRQLTQSAMYCIIIIVDIVMGVHHAKDY
jgi:hypothetical protein